MKLKNLLLFGLIFLCIASCGKKEEDVIKIGALLALTGSGANYGKSLQVGLEIAMEEINDAGGIKGKKLEIVYEDSQGDAKTGISGFHKLITVHKVSVVIGSISSVILAVAPIADSKKIVLVNSSAISPKICDEADDYLFSIMVNGAQEAKFMAEIMASKYPQENIAVLYSNNSSGIDTKNNFINDLQNFNANHGEVIGYDLNTTNFKSHLAKFKQTKAKIGYLIAFSSTEWANILKQTKEIGLNIQWYSYSGIETKETLALSKQAAEGVIYSYPKYNPQDSTLIRFQKIFIERFGQTPDIYTLTSYDGLKLLSQIMIKFGSSADEIQRGLRQHIAFKGIFGEMNFGKKQCVEKELFLKEIKNNKYIISQLSY